MEARRMHECSRRRLWVSKRHFDEYLITWGGWKAGRAAIPVNGRPVKRHFESWPVCLWSVLQSALSRAAKSARQNAGTALTERHMQGYEWLHLRGNCCQAGASYLVSFSLLAIYGRSGSALRGRYLIWILMSSQVKLGLSGDPRGEEKTFTYDCLNSLCLIVNSLLQNKGERNINAIKGNGIMIPFAQSLKSFFTVV